MKELKGVGYVPLVGLGQDARYAYYHASNVLSVAEVHADGTQSATRSTRFTFASGSSIRQIWTTDIPGELFLVLLDTSIYYLYKSINYGASWSLSYTFQTDSYILERGLCVGYPNGIRTYAWAEYTVAAGAVDVIVATSHDGLNWTARWTLNGGNTGTRNIRHFHTIQWDKYEECFWISSGDVDTHTVLLKWDGITALPTDTDPADLAGLGFTALTGAQRYRAVDCIVTKDWIYVPGDATGDNDPNGTEKGIWRANKDLSVFERVSLGDGQYDTVALAANRSTMWTGVFIPDFDDSGEGHLLFSTYMNTANSGLQFESLFMAHTSNAGRGGWFEVGRVYIRSGGVNVSRAIYQHKGLISYSFTRGAGKGVAGETALMRLGARDFVPDKKSANTTGDGGMRIVNNWIPPMHPLYWVSPTGSDSNNGHSPSAPFATIEKALASATAVITYGAGVVAMKGTHVVDDSLTLNWFNYPSGSGYEGESGHAVWLIGEGRDETVVQWNGATLTSSHAAEIDDTTGELMIDSLTVEAAHTNSGARVFFLNAANARVHSRDARIGNSEYRASAIRSTTGVANRYQHFRSHLVNGRTAGGTSAVILMAGGLGEVFEARACLIEGYQGVSLSTDGTGIELYGCLLYDFLNVGVSTVVGNTTGKFWLLGSVFVQGGAGTGYPYNSTTAAGLDRRLVGNAYTVLPQQVADQGITGQTLIATTEFVDSDPREGVVAGSPLIQASRVFPCLYDYERMKFRNPATKGFREYRSGIRPSAGARLSAAR